MADSGTASLEAQRAQLAAEMAAKESEIAAIDAKLARVAKAKTKIEGLKDEARDLRTHFNNDICIEIEGYWIGERKNLYWNGAHTENSSAVSEYITQLDGIHDALITMEHELTVQRNNLDNAFALLANAWSWVTSNLEKLFN